MAKKPAFAIAESDLKKLPRNQQRRMTDLGFVVANKTEAAAVAEKPKAK